MAKQVAPFPGLRKPAANACGELVTFYWDGEYQARCIAPVHDGGYHDDGIAYTMTEKMKRELARPKALADSTDDESDED